MCFFLKLYIDMLLQLFSISSLFDLYIHNNICTCSNHILINYSRWKIWKDSGYIMSTLSEHLPKLSHAEFEKYPEPVEVHYKSGASYTGMVSNHLRCGQGVFKWPNGARYEGQYSENARNGKGIINKNIYISITL